MKLCWPVPTKNLAYIWYYIIDELQENIQTFEILSEPKSNLQAFWSFLITILILIG